jgi:hypothetical protein
MDVFSILPGPRHVGLGNVKRLSVYRTAVYKQRCLPILIRSSGGELRLHSPLKYEIFTNPLH